MDIDLPEFRKKFPVLGFKVRHNFADAVEFSLPSLVDLAQRLPESEVEYHSGKVGVDQDPNSHPSNGLSIAETVRRIEECGSWMVLKNVQQDPVYGKLLREVLDEVYSHLDPSFIGIHREEAFIFISSPNSVTPYHLDEEHNFLCQIRGTKEVSMWDPLDRQVLPEQQIEHMLQIWHGPDYHRNMKFRDEFQQRATVFALGPGDALHFPVGAPHWVKNGPAVSVSFSITFRSALSERQAIVYFINGKLRRLGLNPLPPGRSQWLDSLKVAAFSAVRAIGKFRAGNWLKNKQADWA
jgi:hypothetical protein